MRLRLMATHSISIEPQNRNQKVSLIGIVKLLNKALKKNFFCQSKSPIMDAANLQRKIPNSIFLRQKIPTCYESMIFQPLDENVLVKFWQNV